MAALDHTLASTSLWGGQKDTDAFIWFPALTLNHAMMVVWLDWAMWAPRLQLTEGRPPPPPGQGPIDFSRWPEAEAKWVREFEGQLQIEKQ
eukprot:3170458-Rhodomonas_salina.1